jgi:hypothetical protein
MALNPFPPLEAAAVAASSATAAARAVAQAGGLPDTNLAVLDLCNAVISLCVAVEDIAATLSMAATESENPNVRALITKA